MLCRVGYAAHAFGARGASLLSHLEQLGVKDAYTFETDQVHGSVVHYLMWPRKGKKLSGDAFITDRPGLVCFVRTADCVPVLIADAARPAVAAVHAGWRGTAEDVVGKTIESMAKAFSTRPSDCVAAIGPHICGRHYEVGDEVVAAIEALRIGDGWMTSDRHVDLKVANRELLVRAGVDPSKIDVIDMCTYEEDALASWRRDRDEDDRQFNLIVIKNT
jgi:YfiH family protein